MRKVILVMLGLMFAFAGTASLAKDGGQGTDVVDMYTGQVIQHRPFPPKQPVRTYRDPETGVEVRHEAVKTRETDGVWKDPQTGQTIPEKAIER